MAIEVETLQSLLQAGFPDGTIEIEDLAGDGDHYRITVKSLVFKGKSRIAQHQMVYVALQGKMGGELHALSVQTVAE